MLTDEIRTLIENHSAGMVATVNADGTPSVSPKATFLILADDQLAFSNIRSPHTIENLKDRPAIEVCFIDVVIRKSARITGKAKYLEKNDADPNLIAKFEQTYGDYLDAMSGFVLIDVKKAELILSPAYDLGLTEGELRDENMNKLNNIYPDQIS
ncbi:MAG TPA: pyridoxamine 5'-phosphate oxidase family protein [Dehalococcoidia bacterium]|jgi:predicted pyridoxine 5'-phosphate oxidase superfamily flavin-nucleotide-binding protein|nr:pyridoxamine 5'-phosphate oxidase family protein [Dehalococcoidia bacterium]